jgi:multiple sugar transport system ATP-binding protein
MTMGDRIVVMRGGVVQQVGPPQHVYDAPANTFVAAFLGSPRINLLAGSRERTNEGAALRTGGLAIPLTGDLNALTHNATSTDIAIGIRPENIRVLQHAGDARPDHLLLPATVSLVEPVGSDLFVSAEANGVAFTARAEPRLPVSPGDPVLLELDLRRAHLFGADGRNLALTRA